MKEYAAVLVPGRRGRFLCFRHNHTHKTPMSGHWSFPAGKIEPGELPIIAAARELFEEAGIIAHALRFFKTYERLAPGTDVLWRGHFFIMEACECPQGVPYIGEPAKFDDMAFLSTEQLVEFKASPEDMAAVDFDIWRRTDPLWSQFEKEVVPG